MCTRFKYIVFDRYKLHTYATVTNECKRVREHSRTFKSKSRDNGKHVRSTGTRDATVAVTCCRLTALGDITPPVLRDSGFRVGGVGERREEENGRRGYGKRAGTSCEVRAARHGIASFAIDRAKKGRRTSAGEDPIAVAPRSRVPPGHRTRTGLEASPSFAVVRGHRRRRRCHTAGARIRRSFKKPSIVRGPSERPTEGLAER